MDGSSSDGPSPAASPKRMLAIAIGVGDAENLQFVAGAQNGARGFHEWAVASGYESRLVTDEAAPVTFPRLKAELEAMLSPGPLPIHRMLIYFAGHGFIREAEEGLWLLSNWHSELRAVAVEVLRRRLYMYGIRQIGIFADACRSLPPGMDVLDITADPVLGRGPMAPNGTPALDKFIAAQDGTATFAVPGASPEDDRCLFTGILLEGLWGTQPSAFSKILPKKITSGSLGEYLESEVRAIAKRYCRSIVPTVVPAFPEGDNYYFGNGPTLSAPEFPPWPPAESVGVLSQGVSRADSPDFTSPPPPDGVLRDSSTSTFIGSGSVFMRFQSVAEGLSRLAAPTHFETDAGFAIDGRAVRAIWTPAGTFAEVQGKPHWWRLGDRTAFTLGRPAPALIELADDNFVATTALPGFIGSILCDFRGASAIVYRETWGDPSDPVVGNVAIEALRRMEQGGLRASIVLDSAINLRQRKHVDPVLGAVSAYLYDSIGDIDSIRRIAWAYHDHGQAIPYDVALLAQLEAHRDNNGIFCVDIPEVPGREPRTAEEAKFAWTYQGTPAVTGVVAGFWPLLRQGWGFVDDSALQVPGLIRIREYLVKARFSTVNHEGAQILAGMLALERHAR